MIQFGRQKDGKNVFLDNNGLIVNANFNMDLKKKDKVFESYLVLPLD